MKKNLLRCLILTSYFLANLAMAQELTSTDFRLQDPVIFPGDYSTSSSFLMNGVITQLAIGTSTASSFGVNAGFLYFPSVTLPVVTATAGAAKVDLSWTASEGFLGWNVGGYNVGQSTVSGGSYVFTSVGNVTSTSVTGLNSGTTYYFIIRPEDAFGVSIATSTEVSAVPTAVAADGGVNQDSGPIFGGIIETIVTAIIGDRITIPSCAYPGARSDLNCDGAVDLQDLSILFTRPEVTNNRTLSFLFSDFTKILPIPFFSPELEPPSAIRPGQILETPQSGLAQLVENVPERRALPQAVPGKIFQSIVLILIAGAGIWLIRKLILAIL